MGIFGALTTAVSGLSSQSYALQNISGNIANSQTTAFKRTDTAFQDLVSDALPSQQTSGSVISRARATNSVEGDISAADNSTYMAINGQGYFVVQQSTGQVDGSPVFGGTDLYTRRGDFELDKNGYLVNGSGYYLALLPIDPATGNVSGSVPQVVPLAGDILPAKATTSIQYRGNLPLEPLTTDTDSSVPGSELLQAGDYSVDPRTGTTAMNPGTTTGSIAMTDTSNIVAATATPGYITEDGTLTLAVGSGTTKSFTIGSDPGEYASLTDLVDAINADPDLAGVSASVDGSSLKLTGDNQNQSFTIGGTAAAEFGLPTGAVTPTLGTASGYVSANDAATFEDQSIAGQSITVYNAQGTPMNVQLRWAKVNSAETGGQDTWNLFYLTNSAATGTQPMWQNVGQDFTFDSSCQLNPAFGSTTISNLTVDGVNAGDVVINHGTTGLTQYANSAGTAEIKTLNQNGYAAGEVQRLSISDDGRVTAYYSNGQTADIAEIPTVYFNAENSLKSMDGGAFAATYESGPAIPGAPGSIAGASLEGSNTDIADEFTKLIVTQQAYSANTKIISTADDMLQETLNMIR